MTDVLPPQSSLSRVLSSIGVLVVGFELIRRFLVADIPLWILACGLASLVAWAVLVLLPRQHRRGLLFIIAVMIVTGSLTVVPTDGVGIVPVAVGLMSLIRDPRMPMAFPIAYAAIGLLLVPIGALFFPISVLGILSMEAALVVAFLAGQSRRQFLLAEQQVRQLHEASLVAREEQARADVLAARQHIAHDIHDLLAHSLGGLVIQLDAVEALLESGDAKAAAARVRDSRVLAAEGLSEARRAVAALREGPADVDARVAGDEVVAGIDRLLAAHRKLGGAVELAETGARHDVSAPLDRALQRAAREGLTNARKHAPGLPVSARLDWGAEDVTLRIENPLGPSSDSHGAKPTGGGNGLVGMRERFAELPGGVATAAVESGAFVVRVGGTTA